MALVTMNRFPTTTGTLVTSVQEGLEDKVVATWSRKVAALVDQERITLAPDCVIRRTGAAGFSLTVTEAEAELLGLRSAVVEETVATLAKTPSRPGRAT